MNKRPNILLLMSDQHNAKCAGFAGHEVVKTPNLDALAAQGVRFSSAYCQNPICTPSRMCHLSSQYVHNHGYYGLNGPMPHQLPSMFSEMKAQGYHTGAIGKIHLPDHDGWIKPHTDFFHHWQADEKLGIQSWRDWVKGHGYETVKDALNLEGRFANAFDGRPDFLPKEQSEEGYAALLAQRFLRERPAAEPFFLWYTLPKPHSDYKPAQEFWDLYPEDVPLPPNADDNCKGKIAPMRRTLEGQKRMQPTQQPSTYEALRRRKLRGYYGNISHMDWAMGQLLSTLDELNLRDDTLIVYTSDHGDFAAEHGLLEKAPGISSDAIGRVPMIWSWPRHLPQGETRDQLVETIDIWPTIAALCDLPALEMWDGRDISRLVQSEGPEVREAAFTENVFLKCITTREWRLTFVPNGVFPDDPVRGELYNRADDPWEMHNLFHDPDYAEVVRELKDALLSWLMTSTRPVNTNEATPHSSVAERNGHGPQPEDGKTALSQLWTALEEGKGNYI